MAHQHGAYLGGVWSVAALRDRCRINPDTGCWHWSLYLDGNTPMVHVRIGGISRKCRGRSAAVALTRGAFLAPGELAWAHPQCKARDCVNPAHCKSGTKAQWGADLAASGRLKHNPAKVRASREIGRKRRALTDEQVAFVRSSDLSNVALAKSFGVSDTLIAAVRKGDRYPGHQVRGASVFSWGVAA